jgi:hypothetical protein
MKWNRIIAIGTLVLALCAGGAFWLFSGGHGNDVRAMAKRGATETEMLDAVKEKSSQSKLTPDDIIAMKNDGVPESVIIALLNKSKR